jgi:hypothetical protein
MTSIHQLIICIENADETGAEHIGLGLEAADGQTFMVITAPTARMKAEGR